jgi:hypothetical protein
MLRETLVVYSEALTEKEIVPSIKTGEIYSNHGFSEI